MDSESNNSPPVYYTAQDSLSSSHEGKPVGVDVSILADEEKAPHEMVMSLFGALILVSGLLFMRGIPSGAVMGIQSVFLLGYLSLGMWFSVHGYVLQTRVLKQNQMVESYRNITYDNQLNEQTVELRRKDRTGVLMVFWLSVGLGVLQLVLLGSRWVAFLQDWLAQ